MPYKCKCQFEISHHEPVHLSKWVESQKEKVSHIIVGLQ